MYRVSKCVVLLALSLAVVATMSAVGGIYIYEKIYGNLGDHFASRVTSHTLMLRNLDGRARTNQEVIVQLIRSIDQDTVVAGLAYDKLDLQYQKGFTQAVALLAQSTRLLEEKDLTARYGSAVRVCVENEKLNGPTAVTRCARTAVEKIHDEYCGSKSGCTLGLNNSPQGW